MSGSGQQETFQRYFIARTDYAESDNAHEECLQVSVGRKRSVHDGVMKHFALPAQTRPVVHERERYLYRTNVRLATIGVQRRCTHERICCKHGLPYDEQRQDDDAENEWDQDLR